MTPTRKFIIGVAALGTAAAGIASFGTASAATPTAAVAAATVDSSDTAAATPAAPSGPHVANGITEAVLTGDTASSVQAAVTAAYPGATIERMETDAEGAVYEAHVTKADGSDATVKLDASFAITDTVVGHG
jgi:uncharacterized membrane protein YkoI